MSIIDKFLDVMRLNDDDYEFDNEDYDYDEEEDYEVKEKKLHFPSCLSHLATSGHLHNTSVTYISSQTSE